MLKNRDGYLVPCDWEDALSVIAERVCSLDTFFSLHRKDISSRSVE
jgi:hypothetical protein